MKKRIVSAMLAAMMVLSVTTPALAANNDSATQTGNVTMNTQVKNPIYKVSVPTTMDFIIDPFEQITQGSQITSKDFSFVNKSNVPIELDVALAVTAGQDVSIVAEADVNEDDADAKLAYIAAEIASAVTETEDTTLIAYEDSNTGVGAVTLTSVYKDETGDAPVYFYTVGSSGLSAIENEVVNVTGATGTYVAESSYKDTIDKEDGLTLTFALEEATYIDIYENQDKTGTTVKAFQAVAEDAKGSASFRFSGKINSLADWQNTDLTATVTYSFNGLSTDKYTTYTTGENLVDNAWALVKPVPATVNTTVAASVTDDDITVTVKDANEVVVAGATVALYKGEAVEVTATGTTGEDGTYKFEGLAADTYKVTVTAVPTGYNVPAEASVTELEVEEQNVAPTFTAGSELGTINITSRGAGDLALSSITKIEMTKSDGTYDGYNACPWDSSVWGAATTEGNIITLNSVFVGFFNANATTDAVITYTTVGGETVEVTVEDVVTQ